MPFDDLTNELFDDLGRYLAGAIEHRLRERYLPTLMALEQERRNAEVERSPGAGT